MSRISDPSRKLKYYAAGALPKNLVSEGGHTAHCLRIYGDGDLTVTDGDGNQEIFGVYDRENVIGDFKSIDAFTGTGVRVHWPQTS